MTTVSTVDERMPATSCAADMHGDAIFWNPGNAAYQCHRCGVRFWEVTADTPPEPDHRALLADLVRALGEASRAGSIETVGWVIRMAVNRYAMVDGDPEIQRRLYGAFVRAAAAVGEKGE